MLRIECQCAHYKSAWSGRRRDGKIAFDLGHVRAGTKYVLFLHFQVNPTEVGRRPQDVQLLDGERPLLELDRTVTIYP